ncbi:MAG: HPr family phosphocarrier protein [Mariprofundus sp.]|nr:HPr family phosphocarrier protein [Mariprofundus sp.]
MSERAIHICNKLGLHARASAKLATEASRFTCEIELNLNGINVNCKSIMGIMMLAACKGTDLTVIATGDDAQEALNAIETLVNDRFGESE